MDQDTKDAATWSLPLPTLQTFGLSTWGSIAKWVAVVTFAAIISGAYFGKFDGLMVRAFPPDAGPSVMARVDALTAKVGALEEDGKAAAQSADLAEVKATLEALTARVGVLERAKALPLTTGSIKRAK